MSEWRITKECVSTGSELEFMIEAPSYNAASGLLEFIDFDISEFEEQLEKELREDIESDIRSEIEEDKRMGIEHPE